MLADSHMPAISSVCPTKTAAAQLASGFQSASASCVASGVRQSMALQGATTSRSHVETRSSGGTTEKPPLGPAPLLLVSGPSGWSPPPPAGAAAAAAADDDPPALPPPAVAAAAAADSM